MTMQRTRSAEYPRPRSNGASGRIEPDPFHQGLATITRGLRVSVPDLDDAERELLHDFSRGASVDGEIRYRMITLRALLAIVGRSTRPEHREALLDLFRAEILAAEPHRAPLPLSVAFDLETAATGPADVEQRALERNPNCKATWMRCRDNLTRQLATVRSALDTVLHHGWKSWA